MSKVLTVFGATGNQGGSVIRSIQSHPKLSKIFSIRAITRDISKPSAQALANKGVEVVEADLDDPPSIAAAVKGSHTVFGTTDFWEKGSAESETKQGKTIADASVAADVSHLVWSSLPGVTKMTNGELSQVSHFDCKAEVEAYIRTLPIGSSFFWPGLFMTNFTRDVFVKRDPANPDALLSMNLPWDFKETKVPMIDIAADAGKYVATLLLDAEKHGPRGKVLFGAAEFYTPEEITHIMQEVLGKKVVFKEISDEEFRGLLPPPIASELGENMVLVRKYKYYGPNAEKGVEEARKELENVGFEPTSFADHVKNTK